MTTNKPQSESPSVDSLRNELREGSETRFMGTRSTPDGKETVEMIPIEWAAEVIQAREAKHDYDGLREYRAALSNNLSKGDGK